MQSASAVVDVVPVFVENALDLHINDEDLIIKLPSMPEEEQSDTGPSVCIEHIPTGISVQSAGVQLTMTSRSRNSALCINHSRSLNFVHVCAGERRQFANRIKALNRLKAKLLVIAQEQGVSCVSDIKNEAIIDLWRKDTRKYMSNPHKLVEDVKTGIQLPGLNSVLDGNLEPLIAAHISTRQSSDKI